MTNKEAINILKELPDRITGIIMPMDISYDYKKALDIAIKALAYLDEDDVLAIRIVDDTESEDGTDNL